MKKSLICILAIIFCTNSFTYSFGSQNDISSHWSYPYFSTLINENIFFGYEDNLFKPQNLITMSEFVAVINRLFGYSEKSEVNFVNVGENNWNYNGFLIAKHRGYLLSIEDNKVYPDGLVSLKKLKSVLNTIFFDSLELNILEGQNEEKVVTRGEVAHIIMTIVGQFISEKNIENTIYKGNVTLTKNVESLKNVTIDGDLILLLNNSNAILFDNVEVLGKFFIIDEREVILNNCHIEKLLLSPYVDQNNISSLNSIIYINKDKEDVSKLVLNNNTNETVSKSKPTVPPTFTPVPSYTPEPTPAPTATPVPSYTPEPTPTPTVTPVPSYTPEPTPTPTATPVPSYTPKPTPTPTATPVPSYTPKPTPAPTATPVPSYTPEPTPTPVPTPSPQDIALNKINNAPTDDSFWSAILDGSDVLGYDMSVYNELLQYELIDLQELYFKELVSKRTNDFTVDSIVSLIEKMNDNYKVSIINSISDTDDAYFIDIFNIKPSGINIIETSDGIELIISESSIEYDGEYIKYFNDSLLYHMLEPIRDTDKNRKITFGVGFNNKDNKYITYSIKSKSEQVGETIEHKNSSLITSNNYKQNFQIIFGLWDSPKEDDCEVVLTDTTLIFVIENEDKTEVLNIYLINIHTSLE